MNNATPKFLGINDLLRIDGLRFMARKGDKSSMKDVRVYEADAQKQGHANLEAWIAASAEQLPENARKVWNRACQIAALHKGA